MVIGLGEVLWDLLPGGKQLGGAPANFAYHARVLGADAYVASAVGNDALGDEILRQLDCVGLDHRCMHVDDRYPTGTVSVELAVQGKPTYVIHENVAWDHIPALPELLALAGRADALCFGTLAQRSAASRATVQACLAALPTGCLRIFDINLRQHYYDKEVLAAGLQQADVLKLNDEELPILAAELDIAGREEEILAALLATFGLKVIALTRGEKGALLFARDESSVESAVPAKVVDTVGAGDAFTAALAMGLLRGLPLDAVNRYAVRLAAFVCSQTGATPKVPEELTIASQ